MGIRFFCPNVHKLNVKDFQAGQTGICPFCGVKMPIPLESTRLSSKQRRSLHVGGDVLDAVASPTMTQQPEGCTDFSEGDSPIFVDHGCAAAPAKIGTVPQPTSKMGTAPQTGWPAVASRVISRDPLAEEGDVVWYVHPASGGQFGPAAADVMRAWIVEGRVAADSLVWHEGWRNWQVAGGVFSQLSSANALSEPQPGQAELVGTSARPKGAANYRHKRPNTVQIVFIASLALTVIVLFFIFYAIFNQ
jgi:hypothetical protein